VLLAAALAYPGAADTGAATRTVGFDDVPPNKTRITAQYRSSHGVYWLESPGFPPVVANVPTRPHSRTWVLALVMATLERECTERHATLQARLSASPAAQQCYDLAGGYYAVLLAAREMNELREIVDDLSWTHLVSRDSTRPPCTESSKPVGGPDGVSQTPQRRAAGSCRKTPKQRNARVCLAANPVARSGRSLRTRLGASA
jgi:hypothetical protein